MQSEASVIAEALFLMGYEVMLVQRSEFLMYRHITSA